MRLVYNKEPHGSAQKIKSNKLGSKRKHSFLEEEDGNSQRTPIRFERNVSMDSGREQKLKYLSTRQDAEGDYLKNVKRWKKEGIVVDYKLEGDRLLV